MKRQIAYSILFCLCISLSCTERQIQKNIGSSEMSTGKGNGGNTFVSQTLVKTTLENLKLPLDKSFRGLRYLALAEQVLPGSTDLKNLAEVLEAILIVTNDEQTPNIFDDIYTPSNFYLSENGCIDHRGVPHAAGTELLDIGGTICFSLPTLTSQSLEGGEIAFRISLIGLAAHEFIHHFIVKDSHEDTEAIATSVQRLLSRQLHRSSLVHDEQVISLDEFFFVEQFLVDARALYNSVTVVPPPNIPQSNIEMQQ